MRDDERLDTRWRPPRLRRPVALRAAAIAALLLVAALVLLGGQRPPPATPPCAAPAPTPSGALPPGTVGYPLRIPDGALTSVVTAGDRVDVLARAGAGNLADVIAAGATVLRTVRDGEGGGAVVYLAVTPGQARALAGLPADDPVSVTVRSP